jgi:hypothetical protein
MKYYRARHAAVMHVAGGERRVHLHNMLNETVVGVIVGCVVEHDQEEHPSDREYRESLRDPQQPVGSVHFDSPLLPHPPLTALKI